MAQRVHITVVIHADVPDDARGLDDLYVNLDYDTISLATAPDTQVAGEIVSHDTINVELEGDS